MIKIKVTAKLNSNNRVLTATDKVNTESEAYYSIVGFTTWFASVYAKKDLAQISHQLKDVSIITESEAKTIFKYKSKYIDLQVTSKSV